MSKKRKTAAPPPSSNGKEEVPLRLAANVARMIAANTFLSRAELASMMNMGDHRRNVDQECGYLSTDPTLEMYATAYERDGVARRVNDFWPDECWQAPPTVYEAAESDEVTEFEESWDDLCAGLDGEDNWYQDEEGAGIWSTLQNLDRQAGLGGYAVMLMGLDDAAARGGDLSQPVERAEKIVYLRCFPQLLAPVERWVLDPASPRYGQPERYNLNLRDLNSVHGGSNSQLVHWTRVIHVADNVGSDPTAGTPRLKVPWNRLYDLAKLYGGSAEMYWLGAFAGFAFLADPKLGSAATIDYASVKDQVENYMNRLQRYIAGKGLTVQPLAPQVVDPSPQIDKIIEAICIALDVPKRIFMGAEIGQLASDQNQKMHNRKIKGRQRNFCTARIIRPFVNRCIKLGVLPQPKGFSVTWPDMDSMSESEKADVLLKRTQAFASYIQSGLDTLYPALEYFAREAGMDEQEVKDFLDLAAKLAADNAEALAESQQGQEDGLGTTSTAATTREALAETLGDTGGV